MSKQDLDPREWKLMKARYTIEVAVLVPRSAARYDVEDLCFEALEEAKDDGSASDGEVLQYRCRPDGWDGNCLVYGPHGFDLKLKDAEGLHKEGSRLIAEEALLKAQIEEQQGKLGFGGEDGTS